LAKHLEEENEQNDGRTAGMTNGLINYGSEVGMNQNSVPWASSPDCGVALNGKTLNFLI